MHSDEEEVHVWIQGNLNGKDPIAMVRDLKASLDSMAFSSNESELPGDDLLQKGKRTAEYLSLWTTPIEESVDLWEAYGGKSPTHIPIIPWRVTNLGTRVFNRGIPPQLFPASSFMRTMNLTDSKLHLTEVYANYSEFVEMVPLTADDQRTLDYGWMPVGINLYTMSKITEGNYSHLYKVKDESFFLGCGSVVTSAHACFGIGRSNADLLEQYIRKQDTGHGTSGHMIASVLAYQSQFLWYLQEVFNNFATRRSVYVTKFLEPESGAYHTIHEYRNAIQDMKRADVNKLYPNYARNNFEICKKFVSLIKV
jgi:hypothetical protein